MCNYHCHEDIVDRDIKASPTGPLNENRENDAVALNRLALFCRHVEHDLPRALEYHMNALVALRSQAISASNVEIAVTLTDIGNVYTLLNDTRSARAAFEEARQFIDFIDEFYH
uniref:Uncharacterized protein n=1 Tax=Trieres chinensis TaxID=1514140 RepID=A0A7S2EIT6_TRICV|mmetsp:Transcript_25694/g.52617  ORF Transcript_25694/g.52617 Transcript_25694/m.52617 type:complete len:114 (+) Transcript_25694:201-542(+)|eukprot:CAMPEP_0183326124 /NCGR_PEP_ID=MMETSP0160_2-20130417/81401_1 /TAXON_ID=2839 ORGANISM="Odontella Sinensis, Strain Grunow 1884" /NCGR_SAMPLE_ID=MMETSP0160_2 /ASSEMBLY_ACC=CAM_ASM_000250 /LENGTH=113 /DNA_ID=CAMNT_0025494047 /DNA_START=169 /DNA_END=510 /DNA_ORIENTATION=+